jgi:hypothetical protein
MVNKIIDAIANVIDDSYENYPKYRNNVPQNLKNPSFSILNISSDLTQELGNRYFAQNSFDVMYFPTSEDKNDEMIDVGDNLVFSLEYITINKKCYRGTERSYRIVDGVLHCLVNYNVYVKRILKPTPKMLTQNTYIYVID